MTASALYPNLRPSLLLDFANSRQLDPRITFTRSTTATYYDGVTTVKAEENLLTYSQEFDNAAWTKALTTVTANSTAAPDGTTTADTLVPTSASSANHQTTQNFTATASTTYTISVYVKGAGYTKFAVRESVSTGAYYTFDLSASGSILSNASSGNVTVSNGAISSVGNGWYRVSLNLSTSATQTLGIGLFALNNTYTSGDPYNASVATGNDVSGVYIWGAQLEQRSSATAYTATTTQAITNYIPKLLTAGANQPRFDHNPTTGESLGLLIEEQRTNSCTDSVSLLGTGGSTITANATVAPDGSTTCRLINVPSGYAYTGSMSGIVGGNTTWTYSVYIKNYSQFGSATQVILGLAGTYNTLRVTVSNLTGVPTVALSDATNATLVSSSVTSVGNNWYRISVTGTYTGTVGYNEFQFITPSSIVSLFVWGMQLEAGSFATSYIPTVASSVTRNADAASMTGTNFSSWFAPNTGTAFIEGTGGYCFQCHQGASSNYTNFWVIGDISTTSVDRYMAGNYNSTIQWDSRSFTTKAQKMAFAYAVNDVAGAFNGSMQFTDASANLPININTAYISDGRTGWVKKIAYYPIRCTNTQLQALTV